MGGGDDCIVGSGGIPSQSAISFDHVHATVSQSFECFAGDFRQLWNPLDGVHATGDVGQDGGAVSGACADLQNVLVTLQVQGFDYRGDDVGLRNVLPSTDGERLVGVGDLTAVLGNECLSRYVKHGVKDASILDSPTRNQIADHALAGLNIGI